MPATKTVYSKGATVTVTAYGEVLFAASGPVGNWKRRFSAFARNFAAVEAPTNKRPRWAHYGAPLKQTMRASTDYDPANMKVHSAIGSVAPHGYYVDQGTSDFEAKILPPWTPGSASLYEHTWVPPGSNRAIGTIRVRGQKGQNFLDKGVVRAFAAMGMRLVPADPKISGAMGSFPEGLANFAGNTPWSFAFDSQLRAWRAWRDERFNSGRILGENSQGLRSPSRRPKALVRKKYYQRRTPADEARRKALSAERSKRWREAQRKAKGTDKAPMAKRNQALKAEKAQFLAAVIKKYGASNVEKGSLEFRDGRYYITVRVFTIRKADGNRRPEYVEIKGKSQIV